MLVSEMFEYVERRWSVKGCVKGEGDSRLSPSSTCVGNCVVCVVVFTWL